MRNMLFFCTFCKWYGARAICFYLQMLLWNTHIDHTKISLKKIMHSVSLSNSSINVFFLLVFSNFLHDTRLGIWSGTGTRLHLLKRVIFIWCPGFYGCHPENTSFDTWLLWPGGLVFMKEIILNWLSSCLPVVPWKYICILWELLPYSLASNQHISRCWLGSSPLRQWQGLQHPHLLGVTKNKGQSQGF